MQPSRNMMLLATLVALLALSACGVLEVGIEDGTTQDASPTVAPATPSPEPVILTTFSSPDLGLELPMPQGAQGTTIAGGDQPAVIIQEGDRNQPLFLMTVEILESPPEGTSDPLALLPPVTQVDGQLSNPQPLPDARMRGAWHAFDVGEGHTCEQIRAVRAAYLLGERAYFLNIYSDRPGQCDASALPETMAILNGFYVSATVMAMTPTATAAPAGPGTGSDGMRVAYVKEGNVWLWTPAAGASALTRNGGVEQVIISDDGQRIAFQRGGHLWVVNSDGSEERQLTHDADFATIDYGELADFVVGVTPYQVAWLPGTHILLFNTTPQLEGPGSILTDDLWQVDIASDRVTKLRDRGEGGLFVPAPDGSQIAITRGYEIEVARTDGSGGQVVFSYSPVLTYSEYQYYADPVWAPDGASLLVAMPPSDPLADPSQPTELWRLSPQGIPPQLVGHITVAQPQHPQTVAIAPDHRFVAFLADENGETTLQIAPLDDGVGEALTYAQAVTAIEGWSPNGDHFVFAQPGDGALLRYLGATGTAPQPIGSAEFPVSAVKWVDDSAYLFAQQSARGWDLFLVDVERDEMTSVATTADSPPSFDVDS